MDRLEGGEGPGSNPGLLASYSIPQMACRSRRSDSGDQVLITMLLLGQLMVHPRVNQSLVDTPVGSDRREAGAGADRSDAPS